MEKRLRVVIVTQDEPYYIPHYIRNIFLKLGSDIHVTRVYTLPPNLGAKSFLQTVREFLAYFGPAVFSYMIVLRALYALSDLVNQFISFTRNDHSVKLVCSRFKVPCSHIDKINSTDVLDELSRLEPDIVLSVACPQIFGKRIISIPKKGALNIHSSLLPNYRGLNANFWVLAEGESRTGVTIHYVNPGIDDGDILLQEEIPIDDAWSLHDLYLKVMDVGSGAIARCLRLIMEDHIEAQKNDLSKGSYYSFPTGEDVKKFRARNKRFFKYY